MISILILLIVLLFSFTFSVKPSQSVPQSESGPPQQQWRPPQVEFYPQPEHCSIVPKNVVQSGTLVTINVTYSAYYPCDSLSVIRQISYSGNGSDVFSCFGTFLFTDNSSYPAIISKPGHYGNNITLNLINYTLLVTVLNGNYDLLECGTITGGPCDGDELWGVGSFQADDQDGCSCKGVRANNCLFRKIVIKGKCASRCSLGWAVESWNTPVNNWGFVNKSS